MLGALTRLFTAGRGAVSEAAEAIADKNALTILDQQLRDSDEALGKSKFELAGLMGKAEISRRRVADLKAKVARDMELAQRALAKGDESLALDVANRLTTIQQELTGEEKTLAVMDASAERLRSTVGTLTAKITSMRREIDTVRVTEQVQKAQASIVSSGMGAASTLSSASDSLKRIRERQEQREQHFNAQEKLDEIAGGGDLDARLASAGLLDGPPTGMALIEQMKAKMLAAPEAQKALEGPKPD